MQYNYGVVEKNLGASLYLTNGGVVSHPRRQGLLPRGHKHMNLSEGPNLELHVAGNVWE